MILGQIYKDSAGVFRAIYPKEYQELGFYLEQDVQSSIAGCDELLSICNEILLGESPEWSGTGNAHTLTIKRSSVCIENEFVDDSIMCEVSLSDFQIALQDWRTLIETASARRQD